MGKCCRWWRVALWWWVVCGVALGAEEELWRHDVSRGLSGLWVNRSESVQVTREESSGGDRSLRFDTSRGVAEVAVSVPLRAHTVYVIEGMAKAVSGHPRLMGRVLVRSSEKVLDWFQGSGAASEQLNRRREVGGSWERFSFEFGPLPRTYHGQRVTSINVYFSVFPGKDGGVMCLDQLRVRARGVAPSAPELAFRLPHPEQVFDAVPECAVEVEPTAGELEVRVEDAWGVARGVFHGSAQSGRLAVRLPGPDHYRLVAEMKVDGKVVSRAETTVAVTTPLPEDYYSTPQPAFGVWCQVSERLQRLCGGKWTRWTVFTRYGSASDGRPPSAERLAGKGPVKVIMNVNVAHRPLSAEELKAERRKLWGKMVSHQGLVDCWETQNEPMLNENFHGQAEDVEAVMRMQAELAGELTPGVPVAAICLNPLQPRHVRQYVDYYRRFRLHERMEAVAMHPYIPGALSPSEGGYVEAVNGLQRELSAIAGREVPVYVTEIGYSTRPGGEVTRLQQASYLAQTVLLNYRLRELRACVWHNGVWTEAYSRREYDFGILDGRRGEALRLPKPAVAAWATVSRQLYNATYVRDWELGADVCAMLFRRGGERLLALWSRSREPQAIELPLNVPQVAVTGLCGRREERRLSDGVLSLTLTEAPVYVSGAFAESCGAELASVVCEPSEPSALAGGQVTMAVTVPSELSFEGRVEAVCGDDGVQAQVTQVASGRHEVSFAVAAEASPGVREVFLRLREASGRCRGVLRRRFRVLPPVEVTEARAVPAGVGRPAAVALTLRRHRADIDRVVLTLWQAERVVAFGEGKVGEETRLAVLQPVRGRTVASRLTLRLPDGEELEQPLSLPLAPLVIPRVERALERAPEMWPMPEVGRLKDGVPSRHAVPEAHDVPTGTIRLAYDDEFLYVAVDVRDATHLLGRNASQLWQGDSLQFGLSVAPGDMVRPNNDGLQETAYCEFGVGGDWSWTWASSDRNAMPVGRPVPGLVQRTVRDGGWTRYRLALPWRTLNVRPRRGLPLGLSVLCNDLDGKTRHWVEWYGGIADGKDPSRYGAMTLE